MFMVAYSDEDGTNVDQFVVARAPVEAFELWRINWGYAYMDYKDNGDRQVTVYRVPTLDGAVKLGVQPWGNITAEVFAMSDNTLEMQAVRAAHEADGDISGIGRKD